MENVMLRLSELDMKLINRANDRLMQEDAPELVSVEYLLSLIDSLVDEVDHLEEKYHDFEEDVNEYYVIRRDAIEDYE